MTNRNHRRVHKANHGARPTNRRGRVKRRFEVKQKKR